MNPEERQQKILQDINEIDDDLIPRLSQKHGVSEMTIRRDLKVLEEQGLVVRTLGGAMRWPPPVAESALLAWHRREKVATAQKASIARYAAQQLVSDGDIIILEGGTTAGAMVEHLANKQDLTVVTNGFYTTGALLRWLPPTTTVICAGGILQRESTTFVGPVANRFFREFHTHRLFLSATGLTLQAGATDPQMLETDVKRAMVESATEVIMLLDSSKFGVQSLMTVLELEQIDLLVTDSDAPEGMVQGLRARGVDVVIAPDT
ncbi:MAG TPA: DeoR/GlpR family DNA-binding transcription regulator [Anaerolineae bacterium]